MKKEVPLLESFHAPRRVWLLGALALVFFLAGCPASDRSDDPPDNPDTGNADVVEPADTASDAVAPDDTTGDATADVSDDAADDVTEIEDAGEEKDADDTPVDISAYFEPDHVLEVVVEMDPGDWNELRAQTRTFFDILEGEDCLSEPFPKIFTYFPATVTVDGVVRENVGVRKKGFFGSLSDTKPSLKIKFHEYDEEQTLDGLRRITLNNCNQDNSHLNTCIAYGVFHAAGHPAPRCNFAHVTVNGDDLGVYAHVEPIKKPFLAESFGDDDGNLYEGTLSDFRPEWKGTYEKKTNEVEGDFSDIEAAVAACAIEGPEGIEALGEVLDLDRFLTFWALEVLVAHWDGYSGNLNNHWFYVDPSNEKIVFLPWGPDSAFNPVGNPFDEFQYPKSLMANGILNQKLYGDPEWRQAYLDRLQELLDNAWDEDFLHSEVDRMGSLITPFMNSNDQAKAMWDRDRIHEFIDIRRGEIEGEIAEFTPEWPWPLKEPPCFDVGGSLQLSFETTWGTLGSDTPHYEGSVNYAKFQLEGEDMIPEQSGATAGIQPDGPSAGKAVFTIYNERNDGALEILAFVTDPAYVTGPITLPIDGEYVEGYRLWLAPPYVSVDFLNTFFGGSLSLEEAGTNEGDLIKGVIGTYIF